MAMSDADSKGQHAQDVKDDPMLNVIPDVCKRHFPLQFIWFYPNLHIYFLQGRCKWKQ